MIGTRIFATFWLLVSPINTLFFINGLVEGVNEKYAELTAGHVDTNVDTNVDTDVDNLAGMFPKVD
jgi:hypothetical protein